MKYSIAPSALAYLFGDLLEDVFGKKSRFASGEKIPCRKTKVKKPDLATAAVTTAFVHLAEEGHINLTVDKKGLIFKKDTAFAARPPDRPGENLDGLERLITYNIAGEQKKDDVASIIHRLLNTHHRDPWGAIIKEIQEYLINQGYFTKELRRGIAKLLGKKTVPQCEKINKLEGEARQLKETMAAFRSSQPEIYKLLWRGIASGIRSREMRDDY